MAFLLCVQKEPKYAWGCAPRPRRVGTPRPERLCLPGAGLDDACKEQRRICPHRLAVPEKIFALLACSIFSTATGALPRCIRHWRRSAPHPLPLPRFGGGASCPSVHFPKPSAFIMPSAVLPLSANFPLSPPPQRRGQGWWFALPRSSAGAIKKRRRLLGSVSVRSTDDALHRSYPALQATKGGSSRGNLPLDPVLLPFAGAKGRPPRRAVLTKPFIRLRDADRRLQTIPHRAGVQVMPLQKVPPRR